MDKQRQDNQLEPTYSSSVLIQDVALKTCRKQSTIKRGGKRGSGISVLMAQRDDDDCIHKCSTGAVEFADCIIGFTLLPLEKVSIVFHSLSD